MLWRLKHQKFLHSVTHETLTFHIPVPINTDFQQTLSRTNSLLQIIEDKVKNVKWKAKTIISGNCVIHSINKFNVKIN